MLFNMQRRGVLWCRDTVRCEQSGPFQPVLHVQVLSTPQVPCCEQAFGHTVVALAGDGVVQQQMNISSSSTTEHNTLPQWGVDPAMIDADGW